MLDLTKIEAGKMDITWETIAVEELVQLMHRHQLQPMTVQKSLRFDVNVSEDVPGAITSDVVRLNQILRNLLMNAIKFTEHGRISLLVQLDPQAVSSDWVVFTVSDTGIGIGRDKQQLIFEAFQQEDGAINRKYGGTGLGLSISLRLAKLLGGTITVHSRKGEGSRFSLHLPVRPDNTYAVQAGTEGSSAERPGQSKEAVV